MGWGVFSPIQNALGGVVDTARSITGGLAGAGEDVVAGFGGAAKDFLSSPVGQIIASYYLPSFGANIGSSLFASEIAAGTMAPEVAKAVGTALASTALQTANGVDFDTALQNATVNAVVQTGSPSVANDIAKVAGSTGVADAVTSAGASIAATIAKGGNLSQALDNAGAAIAASGASQLASAGDLSQPTSREIGAAVGGALTGGATGAALGLAGEAGRPTSGGKGVQVASAETDPNVVSDTPTDVGLQTITAQKEPDIGGTDVQVIDAIRKQADKAPTTQIPQVDVTAPKVPSNIADTDIQTIEVVGKKENVPTVDVTAPKESTPIEKTDIQIEDPITDAPAEEEPPPEEPYDPNLFIYSGFTKKPGVLGQALGTGAPFSESYPTSSATTGLTSYRSAGEIEGSPGTERKNVWNEASLRLKDALGI